MLCFAIDLTVKSDNLPYPILIDLHRSEIYYSLFLYGLDLVYSFVVTLIIVGIDTYDILYVHYSPDEGGNKEDCHEKMDIKSSSRFADSIPAA